MTITLLQTNIKWADSAANQLAAEAALAASEKSDLYVFPEMFSTGFATKPEGIAESDGSTLAWMQRMADKYDAAIAGSVAVRVGDGSFRNRFYFVKPQSPNDQTTNSPNGQTTNSPNDQTTNSPNDQIYYDKRHLFTYGGEDKQYTRGENRVIVEWRGVRFLLQVCYDLRFPVFARNKDNAYDAILYVANWPDSRRKVWDVLLRARALENQCYVAGVNRVGDDAVCHYDGGTVLIDAYGRDVVAVENEKEGSVTATLDMNKLRNFRQKFPILNDAD